jgi:Putative zinc-finger
MDRAPLRPVPARPSEPLSDPEAARLVAAALPSVAERDRLALGLVALAGHPRAEVASRLGVAEHELAGSLARARKALRRSVQPLQGSGWCERAERLISDRLDGELAPSEAARLDVHLRNCPRCVEHERRLVQATDALVACAALPAAPPSGPVVVRAMQAVPAPSDAAPSPSPSPPPVPGELRHILVAISWRFLLVLAMLLAIAAVALVIAGVRF